MASISTRWPRSCTTLRVGADAFLHAFEVPASPHSSASGEIFERGHVDHVAFSAPAPATFEAIGERLVERGASDGSVTDLGVARSVDFRDPDGMGCEVMLMVDTDLTPATQDGRRLLTT